MISEITFGFIFRLSQMKAKWYHNTWYKRRFCGRLKREKQWENKIINPHMEIKAGQTKKVNKQKKP